MSASERTAAGHRAKERGKLDFAKGIPRDKCPYKISSWGVGLNWQSGWDEAHNIAEAMAGRCTHRSITPYSRNADKGLCNYCHTEVPTFQFKTRYDKTAP